VTFNPPAGADFTREMDVPVDPSYETEFTALLRTAGYNYDNAEQIVGERVPAHYTDDGWQIDYEPPDMTITERVREWVDLYHVAVAMGMAGAFVFWPIAGIITPIVLYVVFENKWGPGDCLLFYLFVLGIWLFLAFFTIIAFGTLT